MVCDYKRLSSYYINIVYSENVEALGPVHTGTISYRSVSAQKVVRRGVAFTRVRKKNQADRSKTGPEIGWYGKVNQKLERYDIVPFRSRVNRKTGPV